MKTLVSCAYNMDNCCVELKFTDGYVYWCYGRLNRRRY